MPLLDAPCQAHHGLMKLDRTPTRAPTTLLLIEPERPLGLTLRRSRLWARLAARVLAPTLDLRLADGHAPESGVLLAVRAQALVSPGPRRRDARLWGELVLRASRPPVLRSPHTPLNRDAVTGCAGRLAEVRGRLDAPGPVSARGVAMANRLLRDGTGPLYDRRASTSRLDAALEEILAALDAEAAGQGLADYAAS
jgi:hypothetical protein